jgi:hypothetical protein
MTVPQIEDATRDDPEPPKTPSIRFSLKKLENAGVVEHEGRHWRLLDAADSAEPGGDEGGSEDDQTEPPADEPEEGSMPPEAEPATSIPGY